MILKALFEHDGARVHSSRILDVPAIRRKWPPLEGGLGDIPSKDGAKVLHDAVKATPSGEGGLVESAKTGKTSCWQAGQ
jgi:hypothetical protein